MFKTRFVHPPAYIVFVGVTAGPERAPLWKLFASGSCVLRVMSELVMPKHRDVYINWKNFFITVISAFPGWCVKYKLFSYGMVVSLKNFMVYGVDNLQKGKK